MDFQDILAKRRAINLFDTEQEPPLDLFRQAVDMAARAPSSYNLQPWNLIVLTGAEEKERLRKVAMNQAKVSEAPIACIVLADADGWREGHPTMERNFREMAAAGGIKPERHDWYAGACRKMYGGGRDYSLAFAAKNAAFFAMSLMYACAHLGLDTHPMDGFDLDGVREAFHIPDNYWIPLLLAVGRLRPGESAPAPKWRKGWDDIVVRFDGDPS